MDPIKVDFTKKKDDEIIIKPAKAGLKIFLNILITLVGAGIAYYIMLPPMNFKSTDMYIFFAIVAVIYCVTAAITSGALRKGEYIPYVKKQSIVPIIIVGVLAVIFVIGLLISSVIFRANSYKDIIQVQEGDFAKEVDTIDFASVPRIDRDAALNIANRSLGALSDLVSQFKVNMVPNAGKDAQINYKNTPVRVVPLEYANLIKWFTNRSDGLPGYIVVNLVTQSAEVKRVEGGIKYTTAEHFNRYLMRHLRFQYPTFMFAEPNFEINEEGEPYWICPVEDKTIGLFGGTDIKGAVLVNAVTGESSYHTMDELKNDAALQWIDRVYSDALLVEQFDYYAQYQKGFFNSVLGQEGVRKTTEGTNFLAMHDDVYMYTGVTSVTADQSIVGFTLINQRTKEAKFYPVEGGATEASAQISAQDMVQDLGYKATWPLLLNISGQPTYFMSLKGDSSLVKMYAMVDVYDYSNAAKGNTVKECMDNYAALIEQRKGIDLDVDMSGINAGENSDNPQQQEKPKTQAVTGAIADIRTAVKGGESYYYLKLDKGAAYYAIKASDAETVVVLNKGDTVTITIPMDAKGDIISASAITKGSPQKGDAA